MDKKILTGLSVAGFLALAPLAHATEAAADAHHDEAKAEAAEKHCAGEKDEKGAEKHCDHAAKAAAHDEKSCGNGSCGAAKKSADKK